MRTSGRIGHELALDLPECASGQVQFTLRCSLRMKPSRRQRLSALFIVAYLTTSVVNEALHLLPGMGHYVRMPSGTYLWLGEKRDGEYELYKFTPANSNSIWTLPTKKKGNILDEDECSICHLHSLNSESCSAAYWVPPTLVCGSPILYRPAIVAFDSEHFRDARAPPV